MRTPPATHPVRGDITIGLDRVDEPLDDATLVKLSLGSSPEIEERLTSLGLPRTLADDDKRRMLTLIDALEDQLAFWIEDVRSIRASLEPASEHGSPSRPTK